MRKIVNLPLLALLAMLPDTAHAYIEPGSGSLVLQMLLAALAGGAFYFRTTLAKMINLFRRANRTPPPNDEPGPGQRE